MTSLFAQSIFLLFILVSFGAGAEWNGLLGKFTTSIFGNNGFFDLPLTKIEAISSNPQYHDAEFEDAEFEVKTYCLKDDPHVCPLFDKNDRVAGLRISHLKSEVADDLKTFPYKFNEISVFTSSKILGHDLWYTTFLFTNPVNLKKGGRGKITREETADGLWVKLDDGWTEIPRDECKAQKAGWKKQGFILWMGNHYTKGNTDDCSKFLPLLPIFHKGRLIALSFAPLGKNKAITRDWFEEVPSDVIKRIIPNGYEPCLEKWTKQYKASSFHFYFDKHPRFILWDRSPSC